MKTPENLNNSQLAFLLACSSLCSLQNMLEHGAGASYEDLVTPIGAAFMERAACMSPSDTFGCMAYLQAALEKELDGKGSPELRAVLDKARAMIESLPEMDGTMDDDDGEAVED
jgi:hypothetical protein